MKNLLMILAVLQLSGIYAQDAYFSNQSFELGEIPDESRCKKQFSDAETIYGLIYYDKSFDDFGITDASDAQSVDGKKYKFKLVDINYQFGNTPVTMISKRAYAQVLCEYEGKSYLMLTLIPDPSDCYFMSKFPECMGDMYSSGIFANSFNMVIKSFDNPPFKFSTKIKLKRTKKSDEGTKFLRSLKTECYDNPKNFQKDFHNAVDIADAVELTFEDAKLSFDSDLSPGTSFNFNLETKKAGEEFKDGRYSWPGFDFECDGCSVVNGNFIVDPLPFGLNGNEKITVTAKNLHNPSCTASFTHELTYSGEYTFNYSGAKGAKGRSDDLRGYDGQDGLDAYAMEIFVTAYKNDFVLIKIVHAKDNSASYYLFKKNDSSLNIINRGGQGGTGGMARNQQIGSNGNGGNGGTGGAVIIYLDPSVKEYADRIKVDNRGGDGGMYISGKGGAAGQAGQSGAAPKFVHQPVKIEVPN